MNKFNLAILNNFRDNANIKYLHGRLLVHYKNDSIVARYLAGSLTQSVMTFANRAEKEDFMYSQTQTTVYGTGENGDIRQIASQVACLNMRFMDYMTEFIDDNIIFSKRHSQLTNTATWAFNDGLNASSRTIVQSMPRNKLCDGDTSWIDEPNMKSLNPAQDQQYKAIQVQEVTNDNKGGRYTASNPSRTVKTVAETLESWRYPTRGSTIRDDPAGEIVRDRDAPKFRNQDEFPYGNSGLTSYKGNPGNSAPGFLDGSRPPPELARNPNETYQGATAQKQLLATRGIPYGYEYRSGEQIARPIQQRQQERQQRQCCDSGDCGLCKRGGSEGYQTRPELAMYMNNLKIGDGVYSKYSCGGECREFQHAGSCTHLRVSGRPHQLHSAQLTQRGSMHGAKSGLLGEAQMDRIARMHADGVLAPAGTPTPARFNFDDSEAPSQYGILHTSSAIASQDIKMAPGNSLCAYVPANVVAGDGYMYQGVENDTADHGTSADRFSGDSAEYSGEHVDRLLSTKMIQSLNNQYGDKPTPEAVSSLYDMQAGRKKATMNYGGSTMYTGGGNAQHYQVPKPATISPRFTGSDGVQFMRSEGFAEAMKQHDERGVSADSRPYDGNNYVNMPQNNKKLWWRDGFVDDSNPAEMQRLLNRRVFRSWAPGKYGEKGVTTSGDSAQEQIPFWIIAAHKRNYERDVDESVGGFETDGMIRGYGKDMTELYCRIPQKYPCGK